MTEREIAASIADIFQAVERLHALGMPDARGSKVRREAVHFLWELREGPELDSRRPHSQAARAYRNRGETALLRYEHSIPLASCMGALRQAAADPDRMLLALRLYVRPVIVLEEECARLRQAGLNSRLPDGADAIDAIARYQAAGIKMEAPNGAT